MPQKIPIIRRAANLRFDAVCRVKIALQAISGGFMREAQQTARVANGIRVAQKLQFLSNNSYLKRPDFKTEPNTKAFLIKI
jgi:hypothetical protein